MNNLIVISGNIGVGKSTLVENLSQRFFLTPVFEEALESSYLELYYNNPKKYGFYFQIEMFSRRFRNQSKNGPYKNHFIILDRSFEEDYYIFGRAQHILGLMEDLEYMTYCNLYKQMEPFVRKPDIIIFLYCEIDCLLSRIAQRGRLCENSISIEYLKLLNNLYQEWYKIKLKENCKIFEIKTDNLNVDQVLALSCDIINNNLKIPLYKY